MLPAIAILPEEHASNIVKNLGLEQKRLVDKMKLERSERPISDASRPRETYITKNYEQVKSSAGLKSSTELGLGVISGAWDVHKNHAGISKQHMPIAYRNSSQRLSTMLSAVLSPERRNKTNLRQSLNSLHSTEDPIAPSGFNSVL